MTVRLVSPVKPCARVIERCVAMLLLVGDYDDDGYVGLYAVGGDAATPNLLYRNLGDGTLRFEETGLAVGARIAGHRGTGPVFAGVDSDGHLDLFVGVVEADAPALLINKGNGTFSDATTAAISDENGMEIVLTDVAANQVLRIEQ